MSELATIGFVVVFLLLVTAAYTGIRGGAPFVPSGQKERRLALALAKLKDGQTIYDLGSGSGRLLFEAIEQQPNSRAIGVELFIVPYLYSVIRKILGGRRFRNVTFKYRDLFNFNVSAADVVFVYQLEGAYGRLQKKFAQELKDDCRVILEGWPFPDIEPLEKARDVKSLPMYLYCGRQFRN